MRKLQRNLQETRGFRPLMMRKKGMTGKIRAVQLLY